ncbi:spore germination protein GerM [Desulfitispora alkaliphila]|uniref:GerMN domain-containing protein n=1 Tax=Desulfitispora alkaliphila TaxID=622674 RepID=UPI003D20247F
MKKKILIMSVFVLVAGLFLMGCVGGSSTEPEGQDNEQVDPVDPNPEQEQVEVTLYFSDSDAMFLLPEERVVVKDNRVLAEIMVAELIVGPEEEGRNRTLPEETELLSLETADGIAYVNFSETAVTNHWGGSAGETMTVFSVVNTLAQLPEVESVQFLINGEKHEDIWGHFYYLEPIEPDPELIGGE